MAIDASIPLQVRSPQFEPQSNALARVLGMQGQMRQNELGAMQLAQAKQQATDEQQWRSALGNVDPGTPEGLQALMRINPQRAQAIQKGNFETAEAESKLTERKGKAAKDAFDLARAQAQAMLDLISSAKDQPSYDAAMAQGKALGLNPTGPAQFDPAFVSQAQAMALTRVQRLEQENKDRSHGLEVNKFGETKANNLRVDERIRSEGSANRGVQVRGQNMSDSRARELNSIQKELAVQQAGLKVDELRDKADERQRGISSRLAAVDDSINVLDKALAHPGRTTATGLSSVVDPRNYTPGTEAKDFQAFADQIQGKAFLQAFESLRGGGQITEMEGKKATDAIARLSRAQSDEAYAQSLKDLRTVMAAGRARLAKPGQQPAASKPAPASGGIKFLGFE